MQESLEEGSVAGIASRSAAAADLFTGDWGVGKLLDAVQSIQRELRGVHSKMVEVSIIDKSAELVEGAIRCAACHKT